MLKNSSTMRKTRLLDQITGKTMLLKSRVMVDLAILDSQVESILDGGKCSIEMALSSLMRKAKSWTFQVD
jgi:hypothetical protein